MRLCIAGTLSPLYPAILRSVSTSIAFRGSKPKLLCIERTSPRTATIDEVTSTAQMAICDNKQHVAHGDSAAERAGRSRFDDLVRIGAEYLAHRNNAEENPLTNARPKPPDKH